MKRTICLLLALLLCLAMTPAVSADVIYEPEDTFYWDHRGECQPHDRGYYAAGPDNVAVVYRSPVSSAVVERVKNGDTLWISYTYEDENGILWGYTEHYEDHRIDWSGWVPMDYLLLRYDHICFDEEFADRLGYEEGRLEGFAGQTIHAWSYPGSEGSYTITVEESYGPSYGTVFTDDAGRKWGCCPYYFGYRSFWICLDDPTADYRTLYAEHAPQQVTHPVKEDVSDLAQIKPSGPSLGGILSAVCVLAILSGGFLWATRKKK